MALHEFDPSEVFINTSHPNRLSRPLIRTDTSLDRESRAFHCIHYQLSRRPPVPYPNCAIHGTPWKLPGFHTTSPYQFSVPVLHTKTLHGTHTNVADHSRYYTSIHQNRPKLCCLEACREHHETRRDVVSGQTEGNSVPVADDVLRVEGFSHKIVQGSSVG